MTNWIRIVLHKLFGVELVVLEDHDGETNLRIKRKDILGRPMAIRAGMGIRKVVLLPDGKIHGCLYVEKWHPYGGTK